jgi:hypothetical protein
VPDGATVKRRSKHPVEGDRLAAGARYADDLKQASDR